MKSKIKGNNTNTHATYLYPAPQIKFNIQVQKRTYKNLNTNIRAVVVLLNSQE
jgi:hypothetical protein